MWFEQTKLVLYIELIYIILTIGVCIIIILDTRSTSKALAYLLFTIFVPVIGIIFYFSFGINYRKRKMYSKKLTINESIVNQFNKELVKVQQELFHPGNSSIWKNKELIHLLSSQKTESAPIFHKNEVKLLINGEEFFPLLLEELKKAQNHIHIQFYIYENDTIGNQIKDILIQKAKEGVAVRFIYDDFGSQSIRRSLVKELQREGVQAYPFNKIRLIFLANRLNYRNHRKIVVIDGKTAFTGGINVSDKYINTPDSKVYWRDTNIIIKGNAVYGLQQIFLSDWNFCSGENQGISTVFFPPEARSEDSGALVQIVSNGPDSDLPTILYSIIQAVNLAKKEILLTTPYYIPDNSLQEALIIAALSGIEVKLLVPKEGDSKIVDLATQAYFEDLLRAGVRIYLYEKGFVHAKTFVTDRQLASVGTANLDLRSFDLNFEVNAMIYDEKTAEELADIFEKDLLTSPEISYREWRKRGKFRKFRERLIRLISPFL